ncbi:MAG: aKG-HExxH-type peptide beta-hydroxylase [Actinophytocola sp.]|uniref:aKG-HExxH-type peptide beta-hydroxylase n=1 Tax=Actinophytocola sp. TaxID=1872138 RepID=UPI003D6C02F1
MSGPPGDDLLPESPAFHSLSWDDFDAFARLDANAVMVRRLRRAERSRRKLLLHALLEDSAKIPGLVGPLSPLEVVWELLARVEYASPRSLDRLIAHPYTGSWAGYTTRLLRDRIDGVCPLWMHLGHVHALAAAAAMDAGLDFEIDVPMWQGSVALPSLGMARLSMSSAFSTAVVRGAAGRYTVTGEHGSVRLPRPLDVDAEGWWSVRRLRTRAGGFRFSVRLDDVDPYRGLYEPVPPRRLAGPEVDQWMRLVDEACRLVVDHVPDLAESMPIGLVSLVPAPQVPYRNPSASTSEAFGSALVSRPTDGAALAATLIHEYQHIVLGGVLHLTRINGDDPRERIYVPWRDDPRPLSGAVQGVYAFAGVTRFWRELAAGGDAAMARRAAFEFAHWRRQTWRVLTVLRADSALNDAGRRFFDGLAERLGPWQDEPVPRDVADLAVAVGADHRAGWRIRYLRPSPDEVARLARAWVAGEPRPPLTFAATELSPTPVPDGSWSPARTDLVRLGLGEGASRSTDGLATVADATEADVAYAAGRYREAADGYRTELVADPDRPTPLVGLGLALAARGPSAAGRALLHRPELVRAVHRTLRERTGHRPTPERVAAWIGQVVSG